MYALATASQTCACVLALAALAGACSQESARPRDEGVTVDAATPRHGACKPVVLDGTLQTDFTFGLDDDYVYGLRNVNYLDPDRLWEGYQFVRVRKDGTAP